MKNKISFFILFVLVLSTLLSTVPAQAGGMPVITVESFSVQPQWWGGQVFNSGTLVLRATEKPGDGNAHFVKTDGSTSTIRDLWTCTSDGCMWKQYIPVGTSEVWFDSLATWQGFGPWGIRGEGNGIFLMEDRTQIHVSPTWDQGTAAWSLEFSPIWASVQMPWEAIFNFESSCGEFSYTVAPNWESTVVTSTLTTVSTETVNWVLMHPNGDIIFSGKAQGPSCPASPEVKIQQVFIPLAQNGVPTP